MEVNCNLFLMNRCVESKGASALHIYKTVEGVMEKYLPRNPQILDLGSGVGNFKSFLASKQINMVDEVDYTFNVNKEKFYSKDLNLDFDLEKKYEVVTILEVLHFMENPRHLLRQASKHLTKHSHLIVSIPNLHSMTSLLSLIVRGCHSAFWGKNYPSHITPIHTIDLVRMLNELNFSIVEIKSCNLGRIPGMRYYWQSFFPFGKKLFRSTLFTDNIVIISQKRE